MTNYLSQIKKYTLLYFYPKDNTPGCTLEATDFSRLKTDFENLDIEIFGVSKDSEKSHENFCQKHNLQITLISDENLEIHHIFSTFGEKKNYGKISLGTIRSTFLFDSQSGKILLEWRNVKATGHAERVLKEVTEFLSDLLPGFRFAVSGVSFFGFYENPSLKISRILFYLIVKYF